MEDWLGQQVAALEMQWDGAIERYHPDQAGIWSDPDQHYAALTESWNFLDALAFIDWSALIRGRATRVLDLGAGTGWLSAHLSRFPEIKQIDALDSSHRNLSMLPRISELMEADVDKIRPVRGLFNPLPVDAGTYHMIVSSSAVHHAPRLSTVLEECHRVLSDDGVVVLLNETPDSTKASFYRMLKMMIPIGRKVACGRYDADSCSVSAAGLLYDPHLGDIAYSVAQWCAAFDQTGWRHETVRTPLGSYKPDNPKDIRLTHFILTKKCG